MSTQPNNPLHGITLQMILEHLVDKLGWEEMGEQVDIRCFQNEPSIKSSLKFLRRTPWARKEVEDLYLAVLEGRKLSKPKKRTPKSKPKPQPKPKSQPRKPFKKPPEYDDGLDW